MHTFTHVVQQVDCKLCETDEQCHDIQQQHNYGLQHCNSVLSVSALKRVLVV